MLSGPCPPRGGADLSSTLDWPLVDLPSTFNRFLFAFAASFRRLHLDRSGTFLRLSVAVSATVLSHLFHSSDIYLILFMELLWTFPELSLAGLSLFGDFAWTCGPRPFLDLRSGPPESTFRLLFLAWTSTFLRFVCDFSWALHRLFMVPAHVLHLSDSERTITWRDNLCRVDDSSSSRSSTHSWRGTLCAHKSRKRARNTRIAATPDMPGSSKDNQQGRSSCSTS